MADGDPLDDLSDIVNRMTGGNGGAPEALWFLKNDRVAGAGAAATIAGRLTSLWRYEGAPSHGAVPPTTAAVPDSTTDGGLKQTDPASGKKKWLLGGSINASVGGSLVVVDRLLHNSGLSGTSTSAQTVGGTLTRYTTTEAKGNRVFVEINTQIGVTPTTATIDYTDQDGNSATSPTFQMGNTNYREAQRMIEVPLAAGDSGVRAVASITLAGSTGTAGDFGVVIARPLLLVVSGSAGIGSLRDLIRGLPEIREVKDDACLSLIWAAAGTSAPRITGSISMSEKGAMSALANFVDFKQRLEAPHQAIPFVKSTISGQQTGELVSF
ncbi:MAG: hypothetical protein AAB131_05095, partial [Actinomycetota bacterium]